MASPEEEIIWHGESTALIEQADVLVRTDSSGETTSLTLVGPWHKCLKEKPRPGQRIPPYAGLVQEAEARRHRGGKGIVSVTLFDASVSLAEQLAPPKYEIWSSAVEMALETHPRYNGKGPSGWGSKGIKSVVDYSVPTLEVAKAQDKEKQHAILVRLFARESGSEEVSIGQLIQLLKTATPGERDAVLNFGKWMGGGGKPVVEDFLKKWDSGIESYRLFAPFARKTTQYSSTKKPGKIGVISTPTGFGILPDTPDGGKYQWLKSEDRVSWTGKNGTCEQVEEWEGAVLIDPDIYKTA
jgi:hypothetical protein